MSTAPNQHPDPDEIQNLQHIVRACCAEAAAWRTAATNPSTPNEVLIDHAVDLRRRLFEAASTSRCTLQRLQADGTPNQVLTAAAVTASLDAAGHAVSPIATGLYRQDHLRTSAEASTALASRFLLAASLGVNELLPQTTTPATRRLHIVR